MPCVELVFQRDGENCVVQGITGFLSKTPLKVDVLCFRAKYLLFHTGLNWQNLEDDAPKRVVRDS